MRYISKIIPVPCRFSENESYSSEHLVSCRAKRQRYISKFNKAINPTAELLIQNPDIDKINENNDLPDNQRRI